MQDKKFTERLKQRLTIEFQNQDRSGAYGFTQRSMAYNSRQWLKPYLPSIPAKRKLSCEILQNSMLSLKISTRSRMGMAALDA